MANEKDAVQVQPEEDQAKPSRKRGRILVVGAVLGVMVVEALVIFILAKAFVVPDPQMANAGEHGALDPSAGQMAPEPVEVEIVRLRAQNDRSQRVLVYDLTVFVIVSSDKEAKFKELIEKRRETVRDRFTCLVRAADPDRFQEPDLASLRTQFKHELEQVLGQNDLVQEVLIPSIMSYPEG